MSQRRPIPQVAPPGPAPVGSGTSTFCARPDPSLGDIYPHGHRGPDDVQSLVLDALVILLRTIPELAAGWIMQEEYQPEDRPPRMPYALVVRRGWSTADETNTSIAKIVDCLVRVYVAGPDQNSRALQMMRIESTMERLIDKQSIGGLTAHALTELSRARAQPLAGGQENVIMTDYTLMFAYLVYT